jgi:hypothetical protein
MCDLGYLTPKWRPTAKRVRDLRPAEIESWMNETFPDAGDSNPQRWNVYARSLIKLVEWLHYEVKDAHGLPAMSKEDVKAMRDFLRHRTVEMPRQPKLSREFLERYERFLSWLREEDPYLYAFAAWGYYSCMRYDEMRRMDAGLVTGSVLQGADGVMTVDGKHDRGKKAVRELPPIRTIQDHLAWWMSWRKEHGVTSEVLFPRDESGIGWNKLSTTYNRRLRRWAKKSGLFTGDCTWRGDEPTGELEWFRSHIVGRHAGATSYAHDEASLVDVQRLTGHKKIEILQRRYINVDAASAAERLDSRRAESHNGHGHVEDQVEEHVVVEKPTSSILASMSVEDKRSLLKELLAELMT